MRQRRSPACMPGRSRRPPRAHPDGTGAVPKTQGSSRSDFCIAYAVDNPAGPSGDDMKRLIVDTPRGYSGNPDVLPQCTNAQFNYANQTSNVSCPGTSQVGDVRANIRVSTILLGTQSLTNVPGRVFNLEHTGNEVARLGIILDPSFIGIPQPKVKILVRITFRPSPDLGLRSIIDISRRPPAPRRSSRAAAAARSPPMRSRCGSGARAPIIRRCRPPSACSARIAPPTRSRPWRRRPTTTPRVAPTTPTASPTARPRRLLPASNTRRPRPSPM